MLIGIIESLLRVRYCSESFIYGILFNYILVNIYYLYYFKDKIRVLKGLDYLFKVISK